MENDELLHKWVNGTLSADELDIFKRRPEYESLEALYQNTADLAAPDLEEEAMLTSILKQDKQRKLPDQPGRRVFLSSWQRYAVAASILLLVAFFLWPGSGQVEYLLAKGERQEGLLPDESSFVLNAESRLAYDKKAWAKERSLHLEGEAFFNVKKGSTFKVMTPNGSVQVLGTQFNVKARKQYLEVECKSGKVAVLDQNDQVLGELTPNNALRFKGGQDVEKWIIAAGDQSTWVDGISRFKKVPLLIVLEELERQFDIQIDSKGINTAEIITCNFQHEDLELALKTSLAPSGIQAIIENGNVVSLHK